jgi:acetyltransferase
VNADAATTQHPLDSLFAPRSLIVVGGSDRAGSVGRVLLENLRRGGYPGELNVVNRKHREVQGRMAHPSVRALGQAADLALIAVPACDVATVLRECGEVGVHSAIVVSAGFAECGPEGATRQRELVSIAGQHAIRMLGPNCVGLARPAAHVQAFFGHTLARRGRLALISQSGAVCTAIVDWADQREIGFSTVVSIGAAADLGAGDVLDYLAVDPETDAILLYTESVDHPRRFMSGLRSAARMKPVVVLKAGRRPEGERAASSHTGALVGNDAVFDSALRRAGAVRATNLEQLFSAAQLLASGKRTAGSRLAIVSNAGGLGVMAADRAGDHALPLAQLNPNTLQALDAMLPAPWSHGNPIDLVGDASPERYAQALTPVLKDSAVDGVIVMLTPQAMTRPREVAEAVVSASKLSRKPLLACFMGGTAVAEARALLTEHAVPELAAPELAVDAFAHLASFAHSQQLLLEVPAALSDERPADHERARAIVAGALDAGQNSLSLVEAKALLQAFHVPVNPCESACSADEAWAAAERIGIPVAMKINSPDISHKSDVGGVKLGLASEGAVREAFAEMMAQAASRLPDARLRGVSVEPMHEKRYGRELLVGIARDPAFGPVISVGAGGTLVELIADQSVALPPLNGLIARDMIERSRVRPLLGAFRGQPAVDLSSLENVLLRLSELACELPEVRELDINPLVVDERGAVAVDARVVLGRDPAPAPSVRYAHMAIEPFPAHLSRGLQLADGSAIQLRPIRPDDAVLEQDFVRKLSSESRYFRFHQSMRQLTPRMLVRFTQIDYDREMAFVALAERNVQHEIVGVSRYVQEPDGVSCEFALVVADAWQGRGVGSALMRALIARAQDQRLMHMHGEVLAMNPKMLALVQHLGFKVRPNGEDATLRTVTLELNRRPA